MEWEDDSSKNTARLASSGGISWQQDIRATMEGKRRASGKMGSK